ncbi:MAG: efflux RND transporter permease subunit [Acidobacteriota bacterium]
MTKSLDSRRPDGASAQRAPHLADTAADTAAVPTNGSNSIDQPVGSFSTRRPVAVLVVFLALGVFGWFSYAQLPVTLMPELSYPTLTVRTEYAGAAPEEVENDISRPVEEALGVVSGLSRISSVSRAGISDVVLELTWDADMAQVTQDVLERLDLVFLPPEAERPLILRYDPSLDPVLELSVSGVDERFAGEEGLRRLRRLAEYQVKRQLETLPGVAAVEVRGGLEEQIQVSLDESALRRTGTSTARVIERLAAENINVAGGTLREGRTEYLVRTLNEFTNLDQIADTLIERSGGRDVRLRDLGEVTFGHEERRITTRSGGAESVRVAILKEADANMVALAQQVRDAVGEVDLEAEARIASGTATAAEAYGTRRGPHFGPPQEEEEDPGPQGLAIDLYRSEGALLSLVADRSTFIQSSIDEVVSTAVLGGLLAVLVLYLFLRNVRSTAIVAVAIPVSLLVTFAPLNLTGVSLNIMSLGGLALGIGMLVDSSIVVLESIFRCREEGDDLITAAVRGTNEVRGAVTASTLTSIAVFAPMVFVEGVAGQAFGDLGLAVVISLLAALAVAVFFIPMLASRRGGEGANSDAADVGNAIDSGDDTDSAGSTAAKAAAAAGGWQSLRDFRGDFRGAGRWRWLIAPYLVARLLLSLPLELVGKIVLGALRRGAAFFRGLGSGRAGRFAGRWLGAPARWTDRLLSALNRAYPRVLKPCLRHAGLVLFLGLGLVLLTVQSFTQLGTELLPEIHQGELTFEVELPVGSPLEETIATLAPVEQAILQDMEQARGAASYIDALLVTYGFDPETSRRADEGEHSARFKVLVDRPDPGILGRFAALSGARALEDVDLKAREAAVVEELRGILETVPDSDARVQRPVLFSFRTPLEVEIQGDDLATLRRWTDDAQARLAALPQLADVESTLKSGAPEVQIAYDRERLARYDLDIRRVAQQVRDQVQGAEATRYNLVDRRIPVVVRLEEDDRETVTDVAELVINPGGERPIPLGAVAEIALGEGPSEVRRVDGQRVGLIRSNLGEASLGEAAAVVRASLEPLPWPQGMSYEIAGQSEEWDRSSSSLWLALALSIFLVYVIMAAQFESLTQPLVILLTVPLAFFGTALALQWMGLPLSVVVFLGMIMLAGIVVNNAIVLVDYINTLRRRGMELSAAVLEAGTVRLRPILMTTATTVLGLAPMAIGLGDGAEIRAPMALAVISGLITSTGLTLVIIPVAYLTLDRLQSRLLGRPIASVDPVNEGHAATEAATEAATLAESTAANAAGADGSGEALHSTT